MEPGDEVVCPAPFFVEYGFYTENHGGVFKAVPSAPLTFEPDLAGLEAAVGEKTRVVLINSPNNPAGVVYSRKTLGVHCGHPVPEEQAGGQAHIPGFGRALSVPGV